MARRRQIEQMVRVTLDAMKSLGSPDSNSKSSTESAALVATTADDSARIEAQTKLKDEIEKALGKSYRSVPRVWDVQITGQAIKVRFSIQDNLTEGLIKGSARSDSRKILQTAQSAGYPYSEITAVGTFAMKDKFGNSHEDEVVRVTYTRSTVDKINWAGFLTDNMYDIADTLWRARSFQ